MKNTHRYFWGFDNGFHVPRPRICQKRIQLKGFDTLEEAQRVLRELGAGFEIVEMKPKVVE